MFIFDFGGCCIGDCLIDFYFDVLCKFGVIVEKFLSGICLFIGGSCLYGVNIYLLYLSVGVIE